MVKNVFNLPEELQNNLKDEFFEDLLTGQNVRLERIVSEGHSSPEDFWYDQEMDEWVIVLTGYAELITKDDLDEEILWKLHPGDSIFLQSHLRHRVEKTSTDPKTVWLALHGSLDNNIR